MKLNIPIEISNTATQEIIFIEIMRTQAMLKLVMRKVYPIGFDLLQEIDNALLKRLADFVQDNEKLFSNPQWIIDILHSQFTE